jgi:lipopolysaccharide transport system permease protein
MAFWQVFAVGLGSSASALTSAGDMVTRINFSKKALVFAPMGRTVVSFLIQLALVGVLLLVYRIIPQPGILLIPLVVLPILLLTLGIGFLVSIMNAIVNDIGTILSLGITFLMYLTPVLYAHPKTGILSQVTKYNPMHYFVSAGRDLILDGRINEIQGFLFSVIFSVALFIAALVIFHLTETRIAERI